MNRQYQSLLLCSRNRISTHLFHLTGLTLFFEIAFGFDPLFLKSGSGRFAVNVNAHQFATNWHPIGFQARKVGESRVHPHFFPLFFIFFQILLFVFPKRPDWWFVGKTQNAPGFDDSQPMLQYGGICKWGDWLIDFGNFPIRFFPATTIWLFVIANFCLSQKKSH